MGDPRAVQYFGVYFMAVATVVLVMVNRTSLLRVLFFVLRRVAPTHGPDDGEDTNTRTGFVCGRSLRAAYQSMHSSPMLFFVKRPDIPVMNKAILYVKANEITSQLYVVHCYEEEVRAWTSTPPVVGTRLTRSCCFREPISMLFWKAFAV